MRRKGWRAGALVLILAMPIAASFVQRGLSPALAHNWWEARRDSSDQSPDPATTAEAVLQVFAARAYGWRGALGVHTWFALKPRDSRHYVRIEVIGWGVRYGGQAIRMRPGLPDAYWFGSAPTLLLDKRGAAAQRLIGEVLEAAKRYPYNDTYTVWPGPNSNTFTAFVAREVPDLGLHLPPHAVGKDYLPGGAVFAMTPSGTGAQASLFGLAGLAVGLTEGLEINLLGLNLGIDLRRPALKLPGIGRLGMPVR